MDIIGGVWRLDKADKCYLILAMYRNISEKKWDCDRPLMKDVLHYLGQILNHISNLSLPIILYIINNPITYKRLTMSFLPHQPHLQ